MSKMFENPGGSLKAIAKFCFYACLILAAILFLIGCIRFLSAVDFDGYPSFAEVASYTIEDYAHGLANEYNWYVDGYLGKMMCKNAIYLALASFGSIPLYAFGCLVEDVAKIKEKLN